MGRMNCVSWTHSSVLREGAQCMSGSWHWSYMVYILVFQIGIYAIRQHFHNMSLSVWCQTRKAYYRLQKNFLSAKMHALVSLCWLVWCIHFFTFKEKVKGWCAQGKSSIVNWMLLTQWATNSQSSAKRSFLMKKSATRVCRLNNLHQ